MVEYTRDLIVRPLYLFVESNPVLVLPCKYGIVLNNRIIGYFFIIKSKVLLLE